MQIERKNTTVTVTHNGQDLCFMMPNIAAGRLRPGYTTTQNKRESEREYFFEINKLWNTWDSERCDKLFSLYEDVYSLITEDEALIKEHMPKLTEEIINLHNMEEIYNLFPPSDVWIPDDMKQSFDKVSPNYSEEMTYLVNDYYQLVCFGIAIRPLIPVFSAVGIYSSKLTRNRSVEETRNTVYKTTYAYNLLVGTHLADDPAMIKLDGFLEEAIVRTQKENKSTSRGAASIALVAVFEGFGSEALQDYLRAYAVVDVLSGAILNPTHEKSNHARTTSLATAIYKGVVAEIKTRLAGKLTPDTFREKTPASKLRMFGEESKVSTIDTIRGRSNAPMKVSILSEVAITDYRSCIKHIHSDLAPAEVKVYIDNMFENPPAFVHTLHEWLVASIFNGYLDRKSLEDMVRKSESPIDSMLTAMAIAQATLVALGYRELATLLSCTLFYVDSPDFVYSFNPLSKEFKDKLDIYYPQGFNEVDRHGTRKINPAIQNINSIIKDWVSVNRFELKANAEVADRLRAELGVFTPHLNIRNDMAELICRTVRAKLKQH